MCIGMCCKEGGSQIAGNPVCIPAALAGRKMATVLGKEWQTAAVG